MDETPKKAQNIPWLPPQIGSRQKNFVETLETRPESISESFSVKFKIFSKILKNFGIVG